MFLFIYLSIYFIDLPIPDQICLSSVKSTRSYQKNLQFYIFDVSFVMVYLFNGISIHNRLFNAEGWFFCKCLIVFYIFCFVWFFDCILFYFSIIICTHSYSFKYSSLINNNLHTITFKVTGARNSTIVVHGMALYLHTAWSLEFNRGCTRQWRVHFGKQASQ